MLVPSKCKWVQFVYSGSGDEARVVGFGSVVVDSGSVVESGCCRVSASWVPCVYSGSVGGKSGSVIEKSCFGAVQVGHVRLFWHRGWVWGKCKWVPCVYSDSRDSSDLISGASTAGLVNSGDPYVCTCTRGPSGRFGFGPKPHAHI
jgi:hypothetical protein